MSLVWNGQEIAGFVFNGQSVAACYNGNVVWPTVDPLNPLGLPPFTIRCKFTSGYTPTMGYSRTLVDAASNVWDIFRDDPEWDSLLSNDEQVSHLTHVLGANTTGVTSMRSLFDNCDTLVSVCLFDTSTCETMEQMFYECRALTHIPLFNTSNVENMDYAFYNCRAVQSGALALYQQASTQANPPSDHFHTFYRCGYNTDTGTAELDQIPSDWGGNDYGGMGSEIED